MNSDGLNLPKACIPSARTPAAWAKHQILLSASFAQSAERSPLVQRYSGGHNHCAPVGRAASRIST
jgi:hypothetical protein